MRTAKLVESGDTPTLVVSGVIGAIIAEENKSEKYAIPSTISIYPTYYQSGRSPLSTSLAVPTHFGLMKQLLFPLLLDPLPN